MKTYIIYAPGMPFDGGSIKEGKSLGGSESAAYYAAKELAKRGNKVFIFTRCQPEKQGAYDDVYYMPIGNVTQADQLGENFTRFAKSVQHDVLIMQRHPIAFHDIYYSKLNFWWTHDLALKRSQNQWNAQSYNVQKILTVSKFHSEQVQKVYACKKEILEVFKNGIDDDLYKNASEIDENIKLGSKTILFTSRPERGLEQLVRPDGIMERLYQIDPEIRLMVAGYDNTTPDTEAYYNALWARCEQLPNVENIGPQGKADLAEIEKRAWLYIYPTEFEETSCITAMHSQAAGTPFIASQFGALSETLKDGGVYWVEKQDEKVSVENFVNAITTLSANPDDWRMLRDQAINKSRDYAWSKSIDSLENLVASELSKAQENKISTARHLIKYSDVQIAKRYCIENSLTDELALIEKEYGKIFTDYKGFYEELNKGFLDSDKKLGLGNFGFFDNDQRPMAMASICESLPDGSKVLDYGCANGNMTSWLANKFPNIEFTGADISEDMLKTGRALCEEKEINNCKLFPVDSPDFFQKESYDLVIAGEFLEHVFSPHKTVDQLTALVKEGGKVFFTVPGGISDWYHSHMDMNEPHQHINYFEVQDIVELVGHKTGFNIQRINYGTTKAKQPRGGLLFGFLKTDNDKPAKEMDYQAHLSRVFPEQSLSVCMITESQSATIGGALDSVKQIADSIIIGIDNSNNDWDKGVTYETAIRYTDNIFPIESPMVQGFDSARNQTIEKAKTDWILWLDDDEVLQWPQQLKAYLRRNQYDSYAVHQHHFSCDPAGIIKTDWPCRVFRTGKGIKFFGLVHEHPETELNAGAGHTLLLPDKVVAICHYGYDSEETRRGRFQRNWPLMLKDREKYPERDLARFLMIRDLSHINRFEFERTKQVTDQMLERAETACQMWRDLVRDKKHRLIDDSLTYYSESSDLLKGKSAINFDLSLSINKAGIGDNLENPTPVKAKFYNENDLQMYISSKVKSKLDPLQDMKYL